MDLSPAGNSPVAGIYVNESDESDESDYVDVAEEVDVYSELVQGRRLAALISVSILATLGLCATGFVAYYFSTVEECNRMADLTFVIDASGSINRHDPGNWRRMLNFVAAVMLDPRLVISLSSVRVGAVVYSDFARVKFDLSYTTNANDMAGRVRNFSYYDGMSNIADGLRKANREVFNEQRGDRPDAPNILVLLTDGNHNGEEDLIRSEAEMARQAGITIIGIGVTDDADLGLLSDIATRPVLTAERLLDLTTLLAQTVALICDITPTN